jgi:hypothetical protein
MRNAIIFCVPGAEMIFDWTSGHLRAQYHLETESRPQTKTVKIEPTPKIARRSEINDGIRL